MKIKKMYIEKGIVGTDIIISLMIIVLFSSIIIGGMYRAFLISAENEYAAIATSYIIQFFEYIDKIDYESVTIENLESIKQKSSINANYNIYFEIENYQDNHEGAEDLLKTIKIAVTYNLLGNKQTIEISKLKVKE